MMSGLDRLGGSTLGGFTLGGSGSHSITVPCLLNIRTHPFSFQTRLL